MDRRDMLGRGRSIAPGRRLIKVRAIVLSAHRSRFSPYQQGCSTWPLCGGGSQFALQFFNCGQAAFQFLRQALAQQVLGYADGLVNIAKRVFGDEAIPRLAKNDADTWLVVGMTQEVVDR